MIVQIFQRRGNAHLNMPLLWVAELLKCGIFTKCIVVERIGLTTGVWIQRWTINCKMCKQCSVTNYQDTTIYGFDLTMLYAHGIPYFLYQKPPASIKTIVSDPPASIRDPASIRTSLFLRTPHTAVLLITQYARMTQCTTVLPGDVQLALYIRPQTGNRPRAGRASIRDPASIKTNEVWPRLVIETRLVFEN